MNLDARIFWAILFLATAFQNPINRMQPPSAPFLQVSIITGSSAYLFRHSVLNSIGPGRAFPRRLCYVEGLG